MPGSAKIFALLPCCNARTVFADKPRSLTCDADVVVGVVEDVVTVTTALLTHFCAAEEPPFEDGAVYIVEGKLASLDKSFAVGENFSADDYDFLIDAHKVCPCLYSFCHILSKRCRFADDKNASLSKVSSLACIGLCCRSGTYPSLSVSLSTRRSSPLYRPVGKCRIATSPSTYGITLQALKELQRICVLFQQQTAVLRTKFPSLSKVASSTS